MASFLTVHDHRHYRPLMTKLGFFWLQFTIKMFILLYRLIQGRNRRFSFPVVFFNMGPEEARNLGFTISGFPNTIFQQVIVAPQVSKT